MLKRTLERNFITLLLFAAVVFDCMGAGTPLRVVSATGSSSLREVTIKFDRPIDPSAASDLFSYQSSILGEPHSATPNPDGLSVTVKFSNTQTPGASYTVNVQNIFGVMGELLDPPSVDVTFKAFVLKPGFLRLSIFDGWGIPDVGVPERELPPPTETLLMSGFDTRTVLPTDSRENYLGRIDGFFIPPTSGNWIFYLRSDDSSEFWIDVLDGYGLVKLQEEPDCCGTFSDHPTATVPLTAGVAYPMIGLYRERSGVDYMQVAARLESDSTPPDLLQPISGNMLRIYAEDDNQAPTARIDTDALVDFSPDFEHPVLISCNWWNACLILDGSLSNDPDGDALTHLWFVEPSPGPFAAGPVATNCLEVGTHTIVLTVTDPDSASDSDSLTMEVVTAPLAIELLMEKVNKSLVSRAIKRELLTVLRTALNQSKAERIRPTQTMLDAFEKKVRAKVVGSHADLAASLIRWSQVISSGMEKCIKAKPKTKLVGYDPKA